MERKSKGRQKVEMAKIPKESNLQVTFSKRRSGLFKKASELCTLCGAEIVIVVFSPGKKAFSFGHPCVETVMNRYLSQNPPPTSPTMKLIEAHRNANIRDLNVLLTQLTNQLDIERKRGEELTRMRKASMNQCWWQKPLEELDLSQLQQLKDSMLQLKSNVSKQIDMLLLQNSQPRQQFLGSGSNQPVLPNFDPSINIDVLNPDMASSSNSAPNPNQGFDNLGFGRGFF